MRLTAWQRIALFALLVEHVFITVAILNYISQNTAHDLTDDELRPPQGETVDDESSFAVSSSLGGRRLSLSELMVDSSKKCENPELIRVDDVPTGPRPVRRKKIPLIVHQTSKTRCLTPRLYESVQIWREGFGASYYFHSDEAVELLFNQDWPEFPHLRDVLHCIPPNSGTVRADLWRYLVLWEFGGIYSDIDTIPTSKLTSETIADEDEAFFNVEAYHLLSQFFMAVSPRHPVMFYTIQRTLLNLMMLQDIGTMDVPLVTGPHALHQGFQQFMRDGGIVVPDHKTSKTPVKEGIYVGTNNHTVRALGKAEKPGEYLIRNKVILKDRRVDYKLMGMNHYSETNKRNLNQSCLQSLWKTYQADRRTSR